MGFIKKNLLKVISWTESDADTIVYKFPVPDRYEIMKGSQLVVRESQAAIFLTEGQIADVFTAGTWELTPDNTPVLSKLGAWKYGFDMPVKSDVYYVSLKQFIGMKWGTANPIMMRDKDFGMIRVMGHGEYSFHVCDPALFMRECFGTIHSVKTDDIADYLRSLVLAEITDLLGECQIPALDLAANYLELGDTARDHACARFGKLGLAVDQIVIRNFKLPEAVEKAMDKRTTLGVFDGKMAEYAQYESVQAMRDSARNPGAGGMFAAAGMGIGLGARMAGQFADNLDAAGKNTASTVKCSKCGAAVRSDAKFCPECGTPNVGEGKTTCPKCKAAVSAGAKFCPECGASLKNSCPKCGAAVKASAKFCPECGSKIK